jgi:hypothetical protein
VLVLPGLALARALFPTRALSAVELLLLSIALSLAVVVVGSVVLHMTPFGLTTTSWTILLACVTVGATFATHVWVAHPTGDFASGTRTAEALSAGAHPLLRPRWVINGALLGLAIGIAISAVLFARTPLPAKGIEGYSALWLLPGDKASRRLDLGVQSSELETTRYRLELRVGKTRLHTYRFVLATSDQWTASPRVRRGWKGTVRALLYRASAPDKVYRHARLLVATRPAQQG